MNEILRHALLSAGLDEVDVAAHLDVDPKTVHRWLEGRLPYARHRWALAHLVHLDETDLWPDLHASRGGRVRPSELIAIYPHRAALQPETWRNLFASAKREISILAYSSLFLAQDADTIRIFTEKARSGVQVRIALADPGSPGVTQSGSDERIPAATAAKTRTAIALYETLHNIDGIELRLHRATLYNSIYRADNELLCGQYVHGAPSARCPVLHLRAQNDGTIAEMYLESFNQIWRSSLKVGTAL